MNPEFQLLDTIERYISGEMTPDERVNFEQLRKTNPDVDQMVVEHTLLIHQLDSLDKNKKLKRVLNNVHIDLAQKGLIQSPKLSGKAKVVYLFNRYKRTTAIAASIAGITALAFSALVWSVSPSKPVKEIKELSREINVLKNHNRQQDKEINNVKNKMVAPPVAYKTGGTGFLIDTKGYLVTNAHIIEGANNIVVQKTNGQDMHARVVFMDEERDLAILKIDDEDFKMPASIPYSIKRSSADIAESVYTLGFPRNDVVYGEGYLAAKTGYNGDTLTCQIAIAANPGNSGGPVLNRNGEVIGVLSAKQTSAEGVVFATQSKYIYHALDALQKDSTYLNIKIPAASTLKGLDRMQQVKKIADYVYMVKGS